MVKAVKKMAKRKNQKKKSKKQNIKKETAEQLQMRAVEYAMRRTPNADFKENIQSRIECLQEYNQALVENGYGFSRKQLREMNLFDIRSIVEDTDDTMKITNVKMTNEMLDYISDSEWTLAVPCFSEGVVQFNDERYVYYKVENIDPAKPSYILTLKDHAFMKNFWEVGVCGTMEFKFYKKNGDMGFKNKKIVDKDHPYRNYSDIYKLLPIEQFGWPEVKKSEWQRIRTYTDFFTQNIKMQKGDPVRELFSFFIKATLAINYYLSKNKPSRPINTNPKRKTEKQISETLNKEKSIRRIGTITIKSEKPPKIITKDSVIRYKTASWQRRATIRTLKNGKKVYVKESVCYRQCLRDKAPEKPNPVNIILTKPNTQRKDKQK